MIVYLTVTVPAAPAGLLAGLGLAAAAWCVLWLVDAATRGRG